VIWRVEFTETAETLLASIRDRRIQEQIIKRAERLAIDPEKQGKPLSGDLFGYYSVRAVRERYRILFQIQNDVILVSVVAVGIRKQGDKNDIYTLAQRLFRQGLLAPDNAKDNDRED